MAVDPNCKEHRAMTPLAEICTVTAIIILALVCLGVGYWYGRHH